jgi:capsular exopolysaccharide synthesis family protein
VDADLRMPQLHNLFGIDQGTGLTGAMLDGHAEDHLIQSEVEGLRLLTSGDLPPNPAEMVASGRMRNVLKALAHDADMLLIDCPPVLPVADATILASMVDGVLLVVRANRTSRKELRDAVENLHKVGGRLLGVVLNGVPGHGSGYYYEYYGEQDKDEQTGLHWWNKSARSKAQTFGENGSHRKKSTATKPGVNHSKK